jgi:ATP-dependent RNA helicase DDX52/ROK1
MTTDCGDAEDDDRADSQLATLHSQRITAKGTNVPNKLESFEGLKERFSVANHLLANLKNSHYIRPTGIQSYGMPILMQVSWPHPIMINIRRWAIQGRDLAAISPTGTGKTLSYLLPIFTCLKTPVTSDKNVDAGNGVRALIIAPTRELAHQIHNECLRLALGRKWKIILFSKATANALSDKGVRDKVGE